jgi:hypothetical protein
MGEDSGETNIASWMCQILIEFEMSTIVRHAFITIPLMLNMLPYKRKLNEESQNMPVWFNKTILAQHFFAHDAKVSKRHNKCLIGLGGLHFWKIAIEWCFQNNASIGFHYGEQMFWLFLL